VAVVLCYLACALIWSTTWFAIRVCIGEGGYATYTAVALRFAIAALILIGMALLWGRPGPRTRRQAVALVAAGFLNGLAYGCVYRAEEDLPGGLVAVLFGTLPLFTALGAAVFRIEKVRRVDVGAAALSLGGMVVLFWDRLSVSPDQALAIAIAVTGVLASVAYSLVMKREAGDVNAISSTATFLSAASLALWLPALAERPPRIPLPLPLAPTLALLYLTLLGSVVAFACYFYLLRRVRVVTASTLVLIQPIIALLVDALWEEKIRLVARSYVGAAITIAGVVVGLTWKWRAAAAGPAK